MGNVYDGWLKTETGVGLGPESCFTFGASPFEEQSLLGLLGSAKRPYVSHKKGKMNTFLD